MRTKHIDDYAHDDSDVQLEVRHKKTGDRQTVGGFMGGDCWEAHCRALEDDKPVTDWYPAHRDDRPDDRDGTEFLAEKARENDANVWSHQLEEALERAQSMYLDQCDHWTDEKQRKYEEGNLGCPKPPIPDWSGTGGMGWSHHPHDAVIWRLG